MNFNEKLIKTLDQNQANRYLALKNHLLKKRENRMSEAKLNFIEEQIEKDIAEGRNKVLTRFPPEPNGYLHLGHAKSIFLNFGLAESYNGKCNLRMDDTNPAAEEDEFVKSIQKDVQWLGFNQDHQILFASDYFDQIFEYAIQLIKSGKAYVDSLTPEQIKEYRGNFYTPGKDSPYRNRSVEENLDLFMRMRKGEFEEGQHVLRAKIDMTSSNINFRDPPMYRILKAHHHRTGDQWSIYPMYDFAHGYCDAIEGITHSICTLEFEDHRPLYDWFLEAVGYEDNHRPHQYEFARLNVTYTVLSKRKLQKLVYENHVSSWTDPRMPTISGMRRRGFTPNGLRKFCQNIGVTKNNSVVDVALLEHAIREDLNESTPRVMAVLNPIKVIIENYPEDQEEFFDAPYYPEGEEQSNQFGSRQLPFSRELWIDKDDFKEIAPKKWFRLAVGAEVRLRYACLLTCQSVVKDEQGEIIELRCTWDPASKGGNAPDGRKVKGTIHWVSAKHAKTAEVRLYDRLFLTENPGKDKADFLEDLNPNSLEIIEKAYIEPSLSTAKDGDRFQFERVGYFVVDQDSQADHLVFNRTLTLKDAWAKLEKKEEL